MKRNLFILILMLCIFSTVLADSGNYPITTRTVGTRKQLARMLRDRFDNVDDTFGNVESAQNLGTGEVFYVDSGEGSSSYTGTARDAAKATLNQAVALCENNRGDVIYVLQNHAETMAGVDGVDLDIAGITVIGLGNGDDAPEFLFDTNTDEFVIGAANITIYNLRFRAGVTAITMGISIEDAGDFFTMINCVFPKPTTNSWEFNDAIDVASGVTYLSIIGCNYQNDDAGAAPNHFIDLGNAALVGITIVDNVIFGDFAVSAIWSNDTDTEVYIVNNTITNMTSGEHCIEFDTNSSSTGICAYNRMFTDAEGTTLDPGSLKCFGNLVTTDVDLGGMPIPVLDDGTTVLNATTVTAIATAVGALDGIGMIGLVDTNTAGTGQVDSAALGGYGNDAFLEGWSLICIFDTGGTVGTEPSGSVRDITDYISTGGKFVTAAWDAALTAGDYVLLIPTCMIPSDYDKNGPTIIYCDDGGSDGEGTSWESAKITLEKAEGICNAGDIIYVGENHNENLGAAANLAVAGITVIGMGEGDSRPLFDFDTNATELTLNAASITIKNLRFRPGATDVVSAIVVSSAGIGCTIDNCAFDVGEASIDEFLDVIVPDTAAEGLTVKTCTYWNSKATAGATQTLVNLEGATIDDFTFTNNTVFGTFAQAIVYSGAAVPVNVNIHDNVLSNTTTGAFCIELAALSTGFISGNQMYADTFGSVLQPGSASCSNNYATNAINTSAHLVPSIDDELAEIGPGRIFYCDSGLATAGDGRSWGTAVKTLDAAVDLCTALRGDTIYVAAGHTETVATDYADLDRANITVIGLGEGKSRPYFNYTTGVGSTMFINADNVTIRNLWFHANITDIVTAIEVETTSEDVIIEDCLFTVESEGTDDFLICIDHAATNNGAVVRNCEFRLGASAATSAIHFLKADYAEITGNEFSGDFSEAAIHNETTASNHILIKDNQIFNGTIAGGENTEPGIELLATTSGMIVNNNIVCLLDAPGEAIVALDCYLFGNKYNGLESSSGAQDIGLVAGREYAVTWSNAAYASADMFDVNGGPILITSFIGQIGTAYDGAHTMTIWVDADTAADDTEFTDSVDINAYLASSLVTFSAANPGAVTEIQAGDNKGTGILMYDWYCPIGVIELLVEGNAATAGDIDYFMTFIPLTTGVTVTPQ